MEELQITLDGMANELADLAEQRKFIESQESEIKTRMMETMKQNNLSVWAFEKGKVAHQSRISYSEWDLSAIKSRIGEHQFDEIVSIRVGELRKKLTAMGIEAEEHDAYFSTISKPKESEWVVLRQKQESG
jgi:hypothetical protein|tara:strand:- start:148 stop:540 length:393 start_codon:yes stop_codon:yes gene_type:complete